MEQDSWKYIIINGKSQCAKNGHSIPPWPDESEPPWPGQSEPL